MALKKLQSAPAFEGQEASKEAAAQGAVEPKAKVQAAEKPSTVSTEQAAPAATQEQATATTTEVAVRTASSVSTAVKKPKYTQALVEYENVIDPTSVEFNTFRRITVGLDGFEDDQKIDLGKEIRLELMSFNDRWVVSPGTQDKEATDFVRYSADGKTIDGTGQDINEYLQELVKVEGYKDASIKKYLSVYGFLTYANGAEIDVIDRSLVAVQVPPQSKALFDRYRIESGFKIAAGAMEETNTLVLRQEKQQGKDKKFAIIRFSSK